MLSNLTLAAGLLLGQAHEVETRHFSGGGMGWTSARTTSTRSWAGGGRITTTTGKWTDGRSSAGPRLFPNLGGFFGRRPANEPGRGWQPLPEPEGPEAESPYEPMPEERPVVTGAPALEATPARLPVERRAEAAPVTPRKATRIALTPDGQITIETVEPELSVQPADFKPALIDEKHRSRVGRGENHAWIIGQLHIKDGVHELHYAVADKTDRFGGVLALQMKGNLSALREGDLIRAEGVVHEANGQSPAYRPTVIEVLQRR